jgi:hypothetical protein
MIVEAYSSIWWVSQTLAAIAYCIIFFSAWTINRKATIISRGFSSATFAIEYLILGLWSGAGVSGINSIRAFIMAFADRKKTRQIIAYIFITFHIALFIFVTGGTFDNWVSYLPLVGAILSTISFSLMSVPQIKALTIIGGLLWTTYFLINGLWVNAAGDILALTLATHAFIRATRKENKDSEADIILLITDSIPIISMDEEKLEENK